MATVIRLSRTGHNNYDCYRISVANSRKAATGKFLQQIGYYDPNNEPPTLKIDEKSAISWLSKGAELSETVKSLFKKSGILEKFRQVKEGKPFEETTAKPLVWEKKKKKPSKKALAKLKAKEDAEKSEEAAPEIAKNDEINKDKVAKAKSE